ncbi:Ku protein [Paenibacillus sp. Marseille-P2973]|uniref:non-homologous end joining protein Ku n=1 Tax=Paenibacillus sp. Marseille-P2973 TaxID=1871032 RepID=UPI001B362E81|nr:Ku protein [Paenibacillus sp. Marseille-P2973]MBQ4899210.1 Ku protein [Paenibacillus sp. Marseille-P2973]
MHTVWKGAISFGLVHVPVKMFSATEDKDISMKYIHKECGSPISYVRRCPSCDVDVNWEEISRGYEYEKGKYVLFEKEELEQLSARSERTITILDFVDLEDIDPIYFQKTYYLSPDQAGSNAYQLLLEAMKQSGKIGIAKIAIRSKSSLAAIRVMEGCLAVETIFYPDEIRPISQVPNLPENITINDKELTMAKLLIEQLSTPFEPEKYNDDYRDNLLQLIEQKVAGEEISLAPAKPENNVIDLMAALQASIEAVKPVAAITTDPGPSKAKRTRGASAASGSGGKKGKAAAGAAAGTGADTETGRAGAKSGSEANDAGTSAAETVTVPKPKRKSTKTAKKTIS